MTVSDLDAIASSLLDAYGAAAMLPPITESHPGFDSGDAYAVLDKIATRRHKQGWEPVGRKIGFTNTTIWELYGVDAPMWAHVWSATLVRADSGTAVVPLDTLVQPRIEPEVVFKLREPIPPGTDDPLAVLAAVEWMAPGFEIVQCHFPDWKFALADCTAAFGLHGALVVGPGVEIDVGNRAEIANLLPSFEVELSRDGDVIDRGIGANVLGSPALAVVHLARALADQPQFSPLEAGEILTTGTVTNAQPIAAGETWTSTYGELGLKGLTVTFT